MAKNLANCNLKEFFTQTTLIKHHVEKWLTETDIMNIRRNLPDIPEDATEEEKKKLLQDQGMANLSAMFNAIFDEHPDDTMILIALICFVPVSDVENHPMTYYMESISEMLTNQTVWDFFTSLAVAARRIGITRK